MASQSKTILILLDKKKTMLEEEEKSLRNAALKKQLSQKLKEIDEAKRRLKEANYGFCETCYKTIPWRELCTHPEKRCCDHCQASA
ncbi:MAG: hypothetical protein KJ645_11080 [Planctomycetes bacterium]|nr:hypothetical protein [Planctomycetota bacterium]